MFEALTALQEGTHTHQCAEKKCDQGINVQLSRSGKPSNGEEKWKKLQV